MGDVFSKLQEVVLSDEVARVWGSLGSGKTTLLATLARRTGRRAIYIQATGDMDLLSAVFKQKSVLDRILKRKLCLMLDESEYLTKQSFLALKRLWDNRSVTRVYSILLASTLSPENDIAMLDSFKDRISETLQMPALTEDDAVKLLDSKFSAAGGKNPFSAEATRFIFNKTGKSPRLLVEAARETASALKKTEISLSDAKAFKMPEPLVTAQPTAQTPSEWEEVKSESSLLTKLPPKHAQLIKFFVNQGSFTAEDAMQKLYPGKLKINKKYGRPTEFGSVSKILSMLRLRNKADIEFFAERDIHQPLIRKTEGKPTRFIIEDWVNRMFATE